MPAESSADMHNTDAHSAAAPAVEPVVKLAASQRLAMIAIGYVPLLHTLLAVGPTVAWLADAGPAWLPALSLFNLFLLPPLMVRLASILTPLREGIHELNSPMFLRWWFTAQWQIVFNRLPALEECLRLVPGLYSTWLRLWGARIGKWVYWSPGVVILDRSLIVVGDRVVFGAAARIHGHVISHDSDHRGKLALGAVHIGDDALIGGLGLLTTSVRVEAGETTPAFKVLHPFVTWRDGRRVRETAPASESLA